MPEEASRDGEFEPLHDAHAIDQVAVGLHFDGPLDDGAMRGLLKASASFKNDLPGVSDLQTVTLAFGNFPGGVLPNPRPTVGRSFKLTRPDGTVERELRLEVNAITYQTSAYTRWVKVWEDAWKFISVVQPLYLSGCKLAAFSLNYVDKFRWTGEITRYSPKAVLRLGSRYVSPHIFDSSDLWHSYTGAFIRVSERTKRLMNLNVDCIDQPESNGSPRRIIQITTTLTDMLNQAGYTPTTDISTDSALEFTQNVFSDLHRFNKELIADVINDDMCKRIGLKEVEE